MKITFIIDTLYVEICEYSKIYYFVEKYFIKNSKEIKFFEYQGNVEDFEYLKNTIFSKYWIQNRIDLFLYFAHCLTYKIRPNISKLIKLFNVDKTNAPDYFWDDCNNPMIAEIVRTFEVLKPSKYEL